MIADGKTKKSIKRTTNTKKPTNSNIVVKKISGSSASDVSVITKTRSPKIIVESESINHLNYSYQDKNKILKFICTIVMSIVILITFFVSIKTYNTVNEISHYILK